MSWTFAGIPIVVTDYSGKNSAIVAKLFPYLSNTVYQLFGHEANVTQIVGKVVGVDRITALAAIVTLSGDTSYQLYNTELGDLGDYILKDLDNTMDKSFRQTIDLTRAKDSPVWTAKLELWYDEP